MAEYIIADTSCLILFDNIGELQILKRVYGSIIITPEVRKEYKKAIPDWIKTEKVKNKRRQKQFAELVDAGEASAIALAVEHKHCILIIDDRRGRKLAASLKIEITGTLGTLMKAKQRGIIPQLSPLLRKLKFHGLRISKEVEEGILEMAGEL